MRVLYLPGAIYQRVPLAGTGADPQLFPPYWSQGSEGSLTRYSQGNVQASGAAPLAQVLTATRNSNTALGHHTLALLDPAKLFEVKDDAWTNVSRFPVSLGVLLKSGLVERENVPFFSLQFRSPNAPLAFLNLVSCLLAVNLVPHLDETQNANFISAMKPHLADLRFSLKRPAEDRILDFDPNLEIAYLPSGPAFSLLFPLNPYFGADAVYPHHLLAQGAAVLFNDQHRLSITSAADAEEFRSNSDYLNFFGIHGNILSVEAFVAANPAEKAKFNTLATANDGVIDEAVFEQVYPGGAKFFMNDESEIYMNSDFVVTAEGALLGTVHRGLFPLDVMKSSRRGVKIKFALGPSITMHRAGTY